MAVGRSRALRIGQTKVHLVTRGFGHQSLEIAQLAKLELHALTER
jgi:hypothetical protein